MGTVWWEHLADPRAVLDGLWARLKPGGVLVVQTQRVLGDERSDLALSPGPHPHRLLRRGLVPRPGARWRAEVEFPHADVAVFTKP